MADFTAQNHPITISRMGAYIATATTYPIPSNPYQRLTLGVVRRIKMRWLDVDALPTVVYRVWVVTDQPDPTGIHYSGPKSGSTPITGATVQEVADS